MHGYFGRNNTGSAPHLHQPYQQTFGSSWWTGRNSTDHSRNYSTGFQCNNKKPTMDSQRKSRCYQTTENKFINGIKNIVNGFIYPALRYDFYSDHHKYYNPRYRNNFGRDRNNMGNPTKPEQHLKTVILDLGVGSCSKSSNPSGSDKNTMDKQMESEVVAIFTSEDFPELPAPRRSTWQSQPKEKCSYFEINIKPAKKKKNRCKRKESCGSEDSFIIFAESPPKCAATAECSTKKCSPSKGARPFVPRQRQISECSDDSFVICFTDDAAEGVIEFSDVTDDESEFTDDSDGEDQTDDACKKFNKKTEICDVASDVTSQLDSGFDEQKEKKVRFNLKPDVHVMHAWKFAYKAARKGHWEDFARDRQRFKHRIENLSTILNPVLESQHRDRIYKMRFCDNNSIDESLNATSNATTTTTNEINLQSA